MTHSTKRLRNMRFGDAIAGCIREDMLSGMSFLEKRELFPLVQR
jgi:hypothetical protein